MRTKILLTTLLVLAAPFPAAAQDSEELILEVPEGPVVTSNRVIGLGGTYVGIAEGGDGHLYNPASFAYRYPETRDRFFDWDWALYWLILRDGQLPDLYAPTPGDTRTFVIGGGLDFKFGRFGVGFHINTYAYEIHPRLRNALTEIGQFRRDTELPTQRLVTNLSLGLGMAYVLNRINLTVGGYLYGFTWDVASGPTGVEFSEISATATGTRFGLLWAPKMKNIRLGLVWRPPLTASKIEIEAGSPFARTPDGIHRPATISLGGSMMLWERWYNPPMTYGLEGLEKRIGESPEHRRRHVTLAADLVARMWPPRGTVSMRDFVLNPDDPIPIRRRPSLGVHAGVESEVWANWLVLRSGWYYEPARTASISGRHHGTAGFAFRIPFWPWDLRADFAADLSVQYFNYGFGVGFWH